MDGAWTTISSFRFRNNAYARSERLLKEYDPEISESVEKALIEQGINLVKGATFERVEQSGEIKRVYVTVNGSREVIESDQLLVATGRKPNTDSLNLSAAGVETGKIMKS